MTLSKLARLTNVSVSTVSKAFSGSREVSAETRNLIFDAARRCGCFEKYYKGRYAKRVIAVICPEIKSEFYAGYVTCLEHLIRAHGATMLLSLTNFDMQAELDSINYYRCFAKADGIIVIGSLDQVRAAEGIPTVGITSVQTKRDGMDCIYIDFEYAMYEAIAHLIESGHRKIAFIGERLTQQKQEVFLKYMQRHKLPVPEKYIVTAEKRFEAAGIEAMARLLSLPDPPTAVIAAYDYIALGAISYLHGQGLSVPEDVSMIGMDNIGVLDNENIALTSIRTDYQRTSELAMQYLTEKMDAPYLTKARSVVVRSELVKRDSVKRI